MKHSKNIGVFDSGFGGLHVLSGIVRELPEYNYIYLGDSARVPYGPRSESEIYKFTRRAIDYLFTHNCDLVILACNSASSSALHRIQKTHLKKYPGRHVLGVLVPSAEEAVARSRHARIGVIGTEATVRSGAFTREIHKLRPEAEVYEHSCPLLVPLVEEGLERSRIAEATVAGCLKPILKRNVDTLILGCTHYGIIEPLIRQVIGPSINIISQERVVPSKLAHYLARHPDISENLGEGSERCFFTTGSAAFFQKLGSRFFGNTIKARKIELLTS